MSKFKLREDLMTIGFEHQGVKLLPWADFCEGKVQLSQMDGALVGMVCGGNLRFNLNGEAYHAAANQMFILHNDDQITDVKASKACKGYILIVGNKYCAMMDVAISDIWKADLVARTTCVFDVEETMCEMMHDLVVSMSNIARSNDLNFQDGALHSVSMSFCYLLLSILLPAVNGSADVKESKSYNVHMNHFIELLSQDHVRERSVEYYASKLGITPKYLTMVCRKCRGVTASQIIDDIVIHNAMRLLRQPNVSMQQIANQLNFPSQSFFGKYFKQRVGISPSRYKGQFSNLSF